MGLCLLFFQFVFGELVVPGSRSIREIDLQLVLINRGSLLNADFVTVSLVLRKV